MMDRISTWLLDRMSFRTTEKCLAFGGYILLTNTVGLCTKGRWHIDSHAYEHVSVEKLLSGKWSV